jgi:hypothetical protein
MSRLQDDTPCPKKTTSLKLAFSKAADGPRIAGILEPQVKDAFDPHSHVAMRLKSSFQQAVSGAGATMLIDENNDVKVLTMAYHVHVDKTPVAGAQHDHTNFGTSLSLLLGYKSSTLAISALALREWLLCPPAQTISAGIVPENAQSLNIYRDTLGWKQVSDKMLIGSIATATWRTLPDPSDPSGETCLEKPPKDLEVVGWYDCDAAALAKQAKVLLDVMDKGYISNKSGDRISVDLSALVDEGLTKTRLQAIAGGVTSRPAILKM